MKTSSKKLNRKKIQKSRQSIYEAFEKNINIRRKSLSMLDSKLKFNFRNINTLLDKINNVKDLIIFNKYDTRDLKSLKNLDNNAILFSQHMKEELKKTSDLLYAYNLSPTDLDNFLFEMQEEARNRNRPEEIQKFYNIKKDFNYLKKGFDIANLGKGKIDKDFNNSFLESERKNRDLYNLKLELFLYEERKKIGENKYFEAARKPPKCIREKDKGINPLYSTIKSKINEKYKLSKSFEIKDAEIEKNVMEEEEDEKNNEIIYPKNKVNQRNDNNYFNLYYKKDNKAYNSNNSNIFKGETIEENNKNENEENKINKNLIKKTNSLNKNKDNKNIVQNDNNIIKKKKPASAHITNNTKKTDYINISTFNTISHENINSININNTNIKKLKGSRVNSANIIQRNNYNISNPTNYNKIFQNNYTYKNKRNRPISPPVTTKQTFYSSTSSSRPMSAFSSINKNNNTIYNYNKNKTLFINKKIMNNNSMSKYRKRSCFKSYINKINKIINYSNYTTNNFKKASNKLKNKKLFKKSNSEIFEKKTHIDITKIKENLKLDENRHSSIDDKKLIYNNSKKVKLMLTPKNRRILNTILMELLVNQKRINSYYSDLSHYEKMIQKFAINKKFSNLTNEMMTYEKRFDKEAILEIFKQDEEKIMEYLKEIKDKDKYDEEEWRHILLKDKNMRIINASNIKKMIINGNLHKKHLVSKFKKEKI